MATKAILFCAVAVLYSVPGTAQEGRLRVHSGLTTEEVQESPGIGSFRVELGALRSQFTEIPAFDRLYGNEPFSPFLGADWYFFSSFATVGLNFKGSFFLKEGKACSNCTGGAQIEEDSVIADEESRVEVTMIPMSASIIAALSPFPGKWVSLEAWAGLEKIFWQEVRLPLDKSASADNALTNQIWKTALVYGASLNFLLNPLDHDSVQSLRGALGIGYIYLSPFIEVSQQLGDSRFSLSRRTLGLSITFESVH